MSLFRHLLLGVFFAFAMTAFSAASFAADQPQSESGTVLETMNALNYTYMNVKTATGSKWVAIPATTVAVGDTVHFLDGMVMKDFNSQTLERTFASILFSPGLVADNATTDSPAAAAPESSPPSSFTDAVKAESQQTASPQPEGLVSAGSIGATAPYVEVEIEKASGDNGYTVAQIFDKAASLTGNTVRVRGKVVKVSPNIMGRNWIHIQDGTGDPLNNSHDLVVTSQDLPETDTVVVAEGVLAADKDFGYGYEYQAIIEEAAISQ